MVFDSFFGKKMRITKPTDIAPVGTKMTSCSSVSEMVKLTSSTSLQKSELSSCFVPLDRTQKVARCHKNGTAEPSGGRVSIAYAKIKVMDVTFPPSAGLGQWAYPTPP